MSVSRHLDATDEELWSLGRDVAQETGKTLYGRADVLTKVCLRQNLVVNAAPFPNNPNHADISDWPADYAAQKAIALELAAAAGYVDRP